MPLWVTVWMWVWMHHSRAEDLLEAGGMNGDSGTGPDPGAGEGDGEHAPETEEDEEGDEQEILTTGTTERTMVTGAEAAATPAVALATEGTRLTRRML